MMSSSGRLKDAAAESDRVKKLLEVRDETLRFAQNEKAKIEHLYNK